MNPEDKITKIVGGSNPTLQADVHSVGAVDALDVIVRDGSGVIVSGGDSTPYAIRVDEASAVVTYVGEADPGTATSAASWRVKKIDTTSGTTVTWADGNASFDNIYDNRASLTYS